MVPIVSKTMSEANSFTPSTDNDHRSACCHKQGSFSGPAASIVSFNCEGLSEEKEVLMAKRCRTNSCVALCLHETHLTENHHHSSLGSFCVPWLGEGLSMSSPNDPVLCCPLPYRVTPVFVQVVSPSLGWSPLSYFLVIWSPGGDTRGPSVVFEAVNMPCPGPLYL